MSLPVVQMQDLRDTRVSAHVVQNVPGRSGEVRAKVLDASDYGAGVELSFSLDDRPQYLRNLFGLARAPTGSRS